MTLGLKTLRRLSLRGGGKDGKEADKSQIEVANPVMKTPPPSPSTSGKTTVATICESPNKDTCNAKDSHVRDASLSSSSSSLSSIHSGVGGHYNSMCPSDTPINHEQSQRFMLRREHQCHSLRIEPHASLSSSQRFLLSSSSSINAHGSTVLGTFHYLPNNPKDMLFKDGKGGIAAVISKQEQIDQYHQLTYYEIFSPHPLYVAQLKSGPVLYKWATVREQNDSRTLKYSMTMESSSQRHQQENEETESPVVYFTDNIVPSLWKNGLPRVLTVKQEKKGKHAQKTSTVARMTSLATTTTTSLLSPRASSSSIRSLTGSGNSSMNKSFQLSSSPEVGEEENTNDNDNDSEKFQPEATMKTVQEETRELLVYPNVDPCLMLAFIAIMEEMIPFHDRTNQD